MSITLEIRQHPITRGKYPITLTLHRPDQPKLEAAARLKFTLTPQEQADLRWYMEDYLHHPNVAPDEHIAQIEALMRQRGDRSDLALYADQPTRLRDLHR